MIMIELPSGQRYRRSVAPTENICTVLRWLTAELGDDCSWSVVPTIVSHDLEKCGRRVVVDTLGA